MSVLPLKKIVFKTPSLSSKFYQILQVIEKQIKREAVHLILQG